MELPHWILVLLMLLEYPKLHLCRRYHVSSSVISSHKSRVPEYCRNSFETIRCYELCKDDPLMAKILRIPPHTRGNLKYWQALKIKQAEEAKFYEDLSSLGLKPRPGVEFPCENKCESDPLYWGCMQECDRRDHTALWDQNCYEPIKPNRYAHCQSGGNVVLSPICKSCMVNATTDMLNQTCEFSYLPDTVTHVTANLCHKMSTCGTPMQSNLYAEKGIDKLVAACVASSDKLPIKHSLEVMKMCVNDRIMVYQYHCCHSATVRNATMCRDDTEKCDDVCMKLLSPRLCRETCKKLRNTNIDKCLNTTCEFQNPFSPDICDHCTNIQSVVATKKTCIQSSKDRSDVLATCIGPNPPLWLQRNCHTYNYLHRFEEFIRKEVNHTVRTEDFSWMHSHLTPIECIDKCSAGSSASNATNGTNGTASPTLVKQCRECVEEEKRPEEIEIQCRTNPFRTIDMFACAIERNMVDLKFDSVVLQFAPRLSACSNDTLRLELYKLAFRFEEEQICPMDCVGGATGYHPNEVGRMRCQIDMCQETGKSPFCQPHTDGHVVQLPEFASCRWKVDFAKSQNPSVLWATYFNELGPSDIKDKLEHPDTTNLLQKSEVNGKEAFYTFPYFIVIRGICDNGYYEDGAFRFFMTGGIPTVELKHMAPTSRHVPKSLVRTVFQSALIKLQRNQDDDLVPENPRNIDGEGDSGCHENICYPAFAVPLMFLHLPHFQVEVTSQEVFADLKQTIYVAAFHSRSKDGKGAIQIALGDYPTHPGMLFPKERGTFAIDSELSYHANCFSDDETDNTKDSFALLKCPELEHVLDDFDRPYDTNYFYPLTVGDIFRAQYTHGTAHVQAIAGFYDPRFLIIGDADMSHFEIVNWAKLLKQMERRQKPKLHACVQPNFKHRGFEKPIYSQLDRTDTDYPINYYRQRYAPMHYNKEPENITKYTRDDELADTAIFEAIALEDRLLLVTTKGLVSFYGHTNATVRADKAWTYSDEEVLNRCFKFVKILRKAQPNADAIVGITYDYVVRNVDPSGPRFTEISQQIWVGTFTYAGKDIEWREIKPDPQSALVIEERISHDTLSPGELKPFYPGKEPGLPYETREASPKSQIEAICYKAFRTQISKASSTVALYDEPGWCEAIDATPVVLKPNTIQVLVRLRIYHFPPAYANPNPGVQISYTDPRVYFYILASHSVKDDSVGSAWFIDSIIPRFPCIDEHQEAVKNVLNFDDSYFHSQGFGGSTFQGCHSLNRKSIDFHIHLNGMTYSRALSNHLFLYGSRLLHSTDNGRSFVGLRSFPQRLDNFNEDNYYNYSGSDRLGDVFRRVHRIELMAFDDKGHYAFLTNKLELWFGSTGSINQIRMRPSPLRSMVQLGISKVRNINDGVPFSIHFDSGNLLYEMVAIVDENGEVSRIMKRPVVEWKILRVKHILQNLDEHSASLVKERKSQKKLTGNLQKPYNYALAQWTAFCAFVSPKLMQNYSMTHSRTQALYFPQPVQHLSLGKSHTLGSLMTFQASTFSIVWNAYFNIPNRLYAGRDKDPFEVWIQEKRDQAILGLLKFSQMQPQSHGIVVQPRKYKRIQLSAIHSSMLVTNYFIDLGVIIELRLEFSIKNDVMAIETDFEAAQLNEIQLNVENANGSIIQINMEKELKAHIAAVLFVVKFSVKRKTSIPQNLPGQYLQPVVMTFHLIGAFGNCINDRASGIMGDSIQTVALVGCPPSRDFVFNWNATLSSIKFRDKTEHGTNERCHDGEFVCFFARNPLVLFFDIFDESQQKFVPYTGKYTLRVIAGGRDKHLMEKYSTEEIEAYNIPGVSDVSLVWNEWDSVKHQKVDRKVQPSYNDEGKLINRDNREMILDAGVSTILWACHTLSPCARIRPTKNLEVVYWFRLSISNRGIDNGTLCLYEKEFDIMLYGFPPSPEFQLLTTLGFSCCLLGIMYVCFRCCRAHRRLWRTTKTNMKNWYHIVKDAFPKKLRLHEPAMADEEKLHKKRATDSQENILDGSITSSTGWRGSNEVSPRLTSSVSSLSQESVSTNAESSQVLPDNKPYSLPAATKEIIYDQILTRRLNSIVVRNRAMRQNLIKKASIQVNAEDLETEAFFEKQFGRTVSQESVFTPPMPKDKKRGIDSFF